MLLGLTLISYGPLIPWLEFYWDDWPYLWLFHQQGPLGFNEFVASDRPFSGWIFTLTTALFGEQAWLYHALALILRWLGAVVFWWIIRQAWPAQHRLATWAVMVFTVYPGFKQQPIALIYNHHLSVLVLFLLSFGAMLLAVKQSRRFWPILLVSLAASASMFSIEYFVGLELLRPILLWLVLKAQFPEWRKRLRRVFLVWLPFLAVLGLFVYWRVVVFRFPSYQPLLLDQLSGSPVKAAFHLKQTVLADLAEISFSVWLQILHLPEGTFSTIAYIAVVICAWLCAGLFLQWLSRSQMGEDGEFQDQSARQMLTVGTAGLFLAGWPVWITGLPVTLEFPYDRLTMGFIPGVSLVIAALIELFFRSGKPRLFVIVALVGLSAGLHFQNANSFRGDSEKLNDFFWQLTWRVPGLQPGTIILSEQMPVKYYSDNSLTAPLNWIYSRGEASKELQYLFYDAQVRLGSGLPEFVKGLPIQQTYRSFNFTGSTDDILVVYYNPPGCVRVLDPIYTENFPDLPFLLQKAVSISSLEQIVVDANPAAQPPAHLLGMEPINRWCFYFEKAELARQEQDWEQVSELWEEAVTIGEHPSETSERLTFMEAFAHTQQWVQAEDFSRQVSEVPYLQSMLCATWTRIMTDPAMTSVDHGKINIIMKEAGCLQ